MNRNRFLKKANDNSLTGIKLYFCTKKVIQGDVRQKLGIFLKMVILKKKDNGARRSGRAKNYVQQMNCSRKSRL